jgi:hypothetical protein
MKFIASGAGPEVALALKSATGLTYGTTLNTSLEKPDCAPAALYAVTAKW